jgi:hypothetical protein
MRGVQTMDGQAWSKVQVGNIALPRGGDVSSDMVDRQSSNQAISFRPVPYVARQRMAVEGTVQSGRSGREHNVFFVVLL